MVCVFLNEIYIPLSCDNVQREAVNITIRILSDGQEILDYSIALAENNETSNELPQGLIELGITDVQLFIADGWLDLKTQLLKTTHEPNSSKTESMLHET